MGTLAQALRRGDRMRAERGLEKARALQPLVDALVDVPRLGHRDRPHLAVPAPAPLRAAAARAHPSVHRPRDAQPAGHRAAGWSTSATTAWPGRSRQTPSPTSRGRLQLVAQSLTDISLEPVAREAVRSVAGRLDPAQLLPDASLGDQNLIAALRPLAVDLLTATGMTSADARACVPRI